MTHQTRAVSKNGFATAELPAFHDPMIEDLLTGDFDPCARGPMCTVTAVAEETNIKNSLVLLVPFTLSQVALVADCTPCVWPLIMFCGGTRIPCLRRIHREMVTDISLKRRTVNVALEVRLRFIRLMQHDLPA